MSDTPYIVSARKYRPSTFRSVVGQKNLTATLKNAIDSGRLAQAYLFCGPRGVGKTSCARIFAKTINCLSPTKDGEACGHCDSCRAVDEGTSFNIIELDAASNNSVSDIRSLTEQVNIAPSVGKYRVFIIDEVHMLTSQAFNAFLKTLEEPPSYVIFILATTEKHKVIPTILSRCQIYDFKRITIQDMVDHLQYVAGQESIKADTASLNVIARKADGAMRDALSIFDQVAASSFGEITYEKTLAALNVLDYEIYFKLIDAARTGNIPAALMLYKETRDRGFDSLSFINGLASHVRDLMVAFSPQTLPMLEVADDIASRYSDQAHQLPVDWLYAAMKILNDCDYKYRTASNKQFLTELTLIRLCQLLNPPTPPFDRVDDENIALRDVVIPPHMMAGANSAGTSSAEIHTATTGIAQEPAQAPNVASTTSSQNPSIQSAAVSGNTDTETSSIHSPRRHRRGDPAQSVKETPASAAFRLSDAVEIETDSSKGKRNESFTYDQLLKAWEDFIPEHKDLQILTAAMHAHKPEHAQGSADITVTVNHPAEKQAFESDRDPLLKHLRETLANDFITVTASIAEQQNVVKQLPSGELLKEILGNNKALSEFVSDSDMEIV